MTNKDKTEKTMAEVEEKARAFTEAHRGESAEDILAQMLGEEPQCSQASPASVSEDFEKACNQMSEAARTSKCEAGNPFFSDGDYKLGFKDGARWQKQKDMKWLADNHKQIFNNGYEEGFEAGRDDAFDETEECVSDDLEKAAEQYAYDIAPSIGATNTEIELSFKAGANWQREQIAKRDKTLDYYTFENGEKHFAQYILEMIANGWHMEAIKSACKDKIMEK